MTLNTARKSPEAPRLPNTRIAIVVSCLLAVVIVCGCTSTKVTSRRSYVGGTEKLPRPSQIIVHDFAASPADVPADSTMAREFTLDTTPQTSEQLATGRELGAQIAEQLVSEIRNMGIPGVRGVRGATPQINDIVIRGYLVSINEGSAAKRVGIGLGAGASELRTAVEGLQMTPQGLRLLASGTMESGSSKTPGTGVGAATFIATANPLGLIVSSGVKVAGEATGRSKVEGRASQTAKEIAKVLKQRFREQGWID